MYQVAYNLYGVVKESSFFNYLKSISDDRFHVVPHIYWIYCKEGLDVHKVTKHIIDNFGTNLSFVISPIDSHDVNGWVGESANKWREEHKSYKEQK
jgi:hypothetical protein